MDKFDRIVEEMGNVWNQEGIIICKKWLKINKKLQDLQLNGGGKDMSKVFPEFET